MEVFDTSGLYYKPITIINDDSSFINTVTGVVIYDRHMFIQTT